MAAAQRPLQFETVAVGIAREISQRRLDRAPRERAHAERILVGGELDDARLVDPHLAREFRDRLPGLVRRDGADVAGGEVANIHQATAAG
jgi:hypothetical protein